MVFDNEIELAKQEKLEFIDIKKVIRGSNSFFLRNMPTFVIRIIEWIAKVKTINHYINLFKDDWGVCFMEKCVNELGIQTQVTGFENLPQHGKYIFISNHPLGAMDAFVIFKILNRKFPAIRAIVNDLLLKFRNIRHLFVPVNVFGKSPKEYIQFMSEIFESDVQVFIFPSGEVSRKMKGKISDCKWKKSFITLATKHKRDVIPIYTEARNSGFFYFVAKFRKMIGIKFNLELILLPREIFKQKHKQVDLVIGKPISYKTFDKSKTPDEWAEFVRNVVYEMSTKKTM